MDMTEETLTGRRTNILGPPAEVEREGIMGDDEENEVEENEEGIDEEEKEGIAAEKEEEEEEAEGVCAEIGEGIAVPLNCDRLLTAIWRARAAALSSSSSSLEEFASENVCRISVFLAAFFAAHSRTSDDSSLGL